MINLRDSESDEEGLCGNCGLKNLRFLEAKNGLRIINCPIDNLFLKMPENNELSFKQLTCPICAFQVVQAKTKSNLKYNFCPYCYRNPPQFEDIEEQILTPMPCLRCPNSDCQLSNNLTKKPSPPINNERIKTRKNINPNKLSKIVLEN